MITLGTIFIVLMSYAASRIGAAGSESSTWLLWVLMLALPFSVHRQHIGWMTTELGRQPWLVYGLFHTRDGYSKVVSGGDTIFTLIGFVGLYFVLGCCFFIWPDARSAKVRRVNGMPIDKRRGFLKLRNSPLIRERNHAIL